MKLYWQNEKKLENKWQDYTKYWKQFYRALVKANPVATIKAADAAENKYGIQRR